MPQELLWACLEAATLKVILNVIFHQLNYCVIIYNIYIYIYTHTIDKHFPDRKRHGDGLVIVSPAACSKENVL